MAFSDPAVVVGCVIGGGGTFLFSVGMGFMYRKRRREEAMRRALAEQRRAEAEEEKEEITQEIILENISNVKTIVKQENIVNEYELKGIDHEIPEHDVEDGRNCFICLPANDEENVSRKTPNVCSICLDKYEIGETVVWSSNPCCEHVFHEECIITWFMKKQSFVCPYCRQIFILPSEQSVSASKPAPQNSTDNANGNDGEAVSRDRVDSTLSVTQFSELSSSGSEVEPSESVFEIEASTEV